MNFKKEFIISLLLILIFAIGTVSANEDVNGDIAVDSLSAMLI